MFLPSPYIKDLTLNVTVFGVLIQQDWCPYQKRRLHAQGDDDVKEKTAVYTPRREASGGTSPADTWISDFQPLKLRK